MTLLDDFNNSISVYPVAKDAFITASTNIIAASDQVVLSAQALVVDLDNQIIALNANLGTDDTKLAAYVIFKSDVDAAIAKLNLAITP